MVAGIQLLYRITVAPDLYSEGSTISTCPVRSITSVVMRGDDPHTLPSKIMQGTVKHSSKRLP